MALSQQIAGALQGLSQNLGMFAGYEANKEQQERQAQLMERREAANRAFQAALYNAKAMQDQQQFEATRADRKDELTATMDYRNRDLEEQRSYHEASISQQAADRAASRDIQRQRLNIEQQNADSMSKRADAATHKEKTDRQANVIGTRLTAVGRLVDSYNKQKSKDLEKLGADLSLMGDDKAMAAARARIDQKYDPVISKWTEEYEKLNAKFGDLTGVDMGSAEEAAMVGTPGSSAPDEPQASPTTDDEEGQPPISLPTAQDAQDALGGYPAGQIPPMNGARKAPDGHWYVPDPERPGKWLRVD